jgi:hypothetical protein
MAALPAELDALAERQVASGVDAVDVEGVRIRESRCVAVGGGEHQHQFRPRPIPPNRRSRPRGS